MGGAFNSSKKPVDCEALFLGVWILLTQISDRDSWRRENIRTFLYGLPGFRSTSQLIHSDTQWPVEAAEFSDQRMTRPPEEDTYYDLFKAKHTTQYLERYIDDHIFSGRSLRERIRFGFEVQNIRKQDSKWEISGQDNTSEVKTIISAAKLIVASGLASTPVLPRLPGKETFEGSILHQESFGQSSILLSPDIQRITVLGEGKSSADMVYASIKAGKFVTWIVRTPGTGSGPGFFLPAKGKGPYKNAFALGSTRMVATFTPSYFNPDNWWTQFLHGTRLGRKAVGLLWGVVDKEIRDEANFQGRPGKKGFEKLAHRAP